MAICAYKMKKVVRKKKRAAAVFLLLAFILLCFAGCKQQEEETLTSLKVEENKTEETFEESAVESTDSEEKEPDKEKNSSVFVYVCGAVNAPGVYELANGSRIYEAVSLAGGIREDAAEEFVNQAQVVEDGEKIYIPTKEEAEQGSVERTAGNANINETGAVENDGKVNLNTASEEELKTLSGIGDTRAKSILEYREINGGFQTIEDLMKVEGIKEGVFDKIKDRITVNTGS